MASFFLCQQVLAAATSYAWHLGGGPFQYSVSLTIINTDNSTETIVLKEKVSQDRYAKLNACVESIVTTSSYDGLKHQVNIDNDKLCKHCSLAIATNGNSNLLLKLFYDDLST